MSNRFDVQTQLTMAAIWYTQSKRMPTWKQHLALLDRELGNALECRSLRAYEDPFDKDRS